MKAKAAMENRIAERPIIFSPWKVRRILEWDFEKDGDMQTRRVIKPQPDHVQRNGSWLVNFPPETYLGHFDNDNVIRALKCPYGKVGSRLWVRETWTVKTKSIVPGLTSTKVYFKASVDEMYQREWKWKSPIFLPRASSRITLEITEIRVERLQEITAEDIAAEGFRAYVSEAPNRLHEISREGFAEGWNKINGKRGYPWESNPWVFVIGFKRIK